MKTETKGIIIYALGHPHYLGMAINLAASIQHNEPTDICLITSQNNFSILKEDPEKEKLFTLTTILEDEKYIVDGKLVFNNAMMHMYELSPFDVTIKLDADMIWLPGRKPSELFEQLKEADLTFENKGHGWNTDRSVWADEGDIQKAYKLTNEHKLYKIYGEFVYFRKCSKVKKFFDVVKAVYYKPRVKCYPFANGNMTDELAYQIACMKTELYPHADQFTPVFNIFLHHFKDQYLYPYQLANKYFALSIGGNKTPTHLKVNYNNLASFYFKALGLQSPYIASNKKAFLPERLKL